MRFLITTLGVLLLGTLASQALALTVTVPDDYSTVQQAVDSGAEVVQVRTGTYEETVKITNERVWFGGGGDITLIAAPSDPQRLNDPGLQIPKLRRLILAPASRVHVEGIWVLGTTYVDGFHSGASPVSFESCRFDSGLTARAVDAQGVSLRGCLAFGNVNITAVRYHIANCTIIGGSITGYDYAFSEVVGNYIRGPAPAGIVLHPFDFDIIRDNTITETTDGIVAPGRAVQLTGNHIFNCSGKGITGVLSDIVSSIANNRIHDCGSAGIDIETLHATVAGNVICAMRQRHQGR